MATRTNTTNTKTTSVAIHEQPFGVLEDDVFVAELASIAERDRLAVLLVAHCGSGTCCVASDKPRRLYYRSEHLGREIAARAFAAGFRAAHILREGKEVF